MNLIMNDPTKAKIKNLIDYATENKISIKQLGDKAKGLIGPVGDDDKRVILIEHGFKVAFSFEQQEEGLFRHISISQFNSVPSVHDTGIIVEEFGFNDMCDCYISIEDNKNIKSINLLDKVKDDSE